MSNSPEMDNLYEDRYYQKGISVGELNTEEQKKRANWYETIYNNLESEMNERKDAWNRIEKAYRCERDYIDAAPNSFIPVITPIIEGQVATFIDKNLSANVKGKKPTDQSFAHIAQIITDYVFKENKIKQIVKTASRRYLLYGIGCFGIGWNPDANGGMGIPEIQPKQIGRVFIDGKIKDLLDFQKAEWVMEEIGFKSIAWVRKEYGNDIADAVIKLNNTYDGESQPKYDDMNSTSIIVVWTRNNDYGNLQKIVMDKRGFMLDESDPKYPYYEFIDNEYPYSFFGMYQQEGDFYRFGDGTLLLPIQETINKLYDEIVTNIKFCSQPRTFIDPKSQCDTNQFTNDPSTPISCFDPKSNIHIQPPVGLNNVVFSLLQNLMAEAQKVSRFSALMSGNDPGQRMTATQAGIQMQQGNNTINDKKMDLADALSFVVKYCIGLTMQFWDKGQALRVSENSDNFEWVDSRLLKEIPLVIPADKKFREKWKKEHPGASMRECPKFMQLKDGNKPITKNIELDVDVTVGEGLPTNKIALYNIILSLAQLQLIDEETGKPRPLLGYNQVKIMIEDLIGLPLDNVLEEAKKYSSQFANMLASQAGLPQQQQNIQSNMQAQQPIRPVNNSPNVEGANIMSQPGGLPNASY